MNTQQMARKKLQDASIRPSAIRVSLLTYLLSHPIHPTADQIYLALQPEMHTLSKTSIYNTLSLLKEAGLVRQVVTDGKEARYDAGTDDHGHFVCLKCQRIYDFPLQAEEFSSPGSLEFDIHEKYIIFTGICKSCRNKMKEEENEKSFRNKNC